MPDSYLPPQNIITGPLGGGAQSSAVSVAINREQDTSAYMVALVALQVQAMQINQAEYAESGGGFIPVEIPGFLGA